MNTFTITFNEKGEIVGGNNLYLGNIRQYSDKTYYLKVVIPSSFNVTLKLNVERPDGAIATYAIPYANNEYKIALNNWVSDLSGELKLSVSGTSGTSPNEQVFIFGMATLYCEYAVKPSTYANDIPTNEYDYLLTLINSKVNKSTTVNGKALNTNITLSLTDIANRNISLLTDDVGYTTDAELTSALLGYVPTSRTINNKALSSNITLTTEDLENDSGYITEDDLGDYAKTDDIPTAVSELTNDSEYQTATNLANVFKGASLTYNASNGNLVLSFTRYNDQTLTLDTINLPTELIVTDGSYDSDEKELVLVLANESEIRIPVDALYNTYFGDGSTIDGYVDALDNNKDKFKINATWITTTITTPLSNKLATNGDGKDVTITFTLPETYTAPSSTESLATIIGKIAKRLSTLGTLADKSTIEVGDLPSGTVVDEDYVATDNNFTDALKTAYDGAVTNSHTHTNKSTLDGIAGVLTEIPAEPGATENYLATVGAIRVLYNNPDLSWDGDADTLNSYPSDLEPDGGTIPVRDVNGSINVTGVNIDGQDITWDTVYGTFDLALLNDVKLQVGQEMHYYGKASGDILNRDVVQFAGVQGDHILIKKAVQSEINANPSLLIGIATQDIDNGDFGYVTEFGYVNDVVTTDLGASGTILWFDASGSTAGALTSTKPTAPNVKVELAVVVKASTGDSSNGRILVRIGASSELGGTDKNVEFGTLANKDLITYNSTTGLWENKTFGDLDLLTATTASSTYQPAGSYATTTDLGNYLTTSSAASTYQPLGNYATLTDGKLSDSVIPSLAITDTFVVTNETEMLALTAQVGDVAIRTDVSKTFILSATPASTLGNWKEVLTPADGVLSVSGSGAIATSGTSSVTVSVASGYKVPTTTEYDGLATKTELNTALGDIETILDDIIG